MTHQNDHLTDQDRLWDHFQNEGVANFDDAVPRLRFLFLQARRLNRGKCPTVLNIGIGNGWLERTCRDAGWNVHSVDPNERAVARLRDEGIAADTGAIADIPRETSMFDMVFCSEVLEHLDDPNLTGGLAEIHRTLKPNGRLLGTVPFDEDLSQNMILCPHCGERFHRWGHRQSFDAGRLSRVLARSGLDPVYVQRRVFADYARPSPAKVAKHAARRALLALGSNAIYSNLFYNAQPEGNGTNP
jgi:SAM-dependent methyltransferase